MSRFPSPLEVVACGFARAPVAALDSELSGWHPVDLAALAGSEALARAQVSAGDVDEIVVGCAEPVGAQGADVARAVALAARWPSRIGGLVIDRAETSGAAALHVAADAIRAGRCARVVVLGLGMASMVPPGAGALNRAYGAPWGDGVAARMAETGGIVPAPRCAETAALRAGLDRGDLDAWADRSRDLRRNATAPAVMSVAARPGDASPAVRRGDHFTDDSLRDWGPTADLPPLFDPAGMTTAATCAPPADSVSALVLEVGRDYSASTGLVLVGSGRAAGDPHDPTGNVAASVARACGEAGIEPADVSVVETVETSAAAAILVSRALERLGSRLDRLNPMGGALATGDAGAAEELRLVVDAAGRLDPGESLLTISAGPTGSAATLWRRRT
jgi:acetyl-CoA acetyltransferase